MRRAVTVLAAVAVLVSVSTATASAPVRGDSRSDMPTPAEPCDWQERYESTIAELGADPDDFVRIDPGPDALGYSYPRGWAAVDPDVACHLVDDVVRHEWMHLQMIEQPGDQPQDELVADCGSWLLGSSYTPYRDDMRRTLGVDPCQGQIMVTVAVLVEPTL